MSIRIIKTTDSMGVVTLTKKIEQGHGVVRQVKITDPQEFAFYIAELAKIDGGDDNAGKLA